MTVVITGANRGIGQGLFRHYEKSGAKVIGTSRQGHPPCWQLDVCQESSLAAISERLSGATVDLLVCNAGVYLDKSDTIDTEYSADKWAATFATNVTGVFQSIQTLLPNLRASNNARVAIISSNMGRQTNANGGSYIYRASKAASINLGRNLANDLRNQNIAVGIYHPGWVITEMGGDAAEISVAQSVSGLVARFDELSIANTGCFVNWDGSTLDY